MMNVVSPLSDHRFTQVVVTLPVQAKRTLWSSSLFEVGCTCLPWWKSLLTSCCRFLLSTISASGRTALMFLQVCLNYSFLRKFLHITALLNDEQTMYYQIRNPFDECISVRLTEIDTMCAEGRRDQALDNTVDRFDRLNKTQDAPADRSTTKWV